MKPDENAIVFMEGLPSFPTRSKEEWNKDHRAFVFNVLLPMVRCRKEVDRMIRCAYDAGYEKKSDGSTLVCDFSYKYGNIKDPMGVTHDYIRWLHTNGMKDPFGHTWTYVEWNNWYFKSYKDFGYPVIAAVRWTGLMAGGWYIWNFSEKDKKDLGFLMSIDNKR